MKTPEEWLTEKHQGNPGHSRGIEEWIRAIQADARKELVETGKIDWCEHGYEADWCYRCSEARYEARIRQLEAALRAVEFGSNGHTQCCECESWNWEPHRPTCLIGLALAATTPE